MPPTLIRPALECPARVVLSGQWALRFRGFEPHAGTPCPRRKRYTVGERRRVRRCSCSMLDGLVPPWSALTCPYRMLDPAVPVMEATEPRNRYNPADPPDRPVDWSILAQRQPSASLIIVGHIRPQDSPQVGFPEDDHMIKAFPSDRADKPLDISVLWRLRRRWSIPDAHCSRTA
jgi:hypothetical protein